MSDAWFFGCWNEPGHLCFPAGGTRTRGPDLEWVDGGYAPRRWLDGKTRYRHLVQNPSLCWAMEGATSEDRQRITYDASEWKQGFFLVHHLPLGTLMSWWDRTQGDTRGGSNSNLLVLGDKLGAERMVAVLGESFPHVIANLARAVGALQEAKL